MNQSCKSAHGQQNLTTERERENEGDRYTEKSSARHCPWSQRLTVNSRLFSVREILSNADGRF